MAEKLDSNSILEAIRDGFARASTEKQIQALTDTVKSTLATLEERFSSIERRLKAAETRDEELVALVNKEFTKTRTHVTDQVETIEGGGEIDDSEPPEWIKPLIPAIQDRMGWLFDKEVGDAIKGKLKGWINQKAGGKGGKIAAGDEE